MATATELHPAATTMEVEQEKLTPSREEAQAILIHLLARLQDQRSKYYARYGRWVERHTKLADFCFQCVRPKVWEALASALDYKIVHSIGGEFVWQDRGVYFDVVQGASDGFTRLYIGQSKNLRTRVAQHTNFRYRRDNPSLHYHALQKSKENGFGILCLLPSQNMGNHRLPGMDEPDLLLNVLEMWMCLIFRCLPKETLEEWLPVGVKNQGTMGVLNIQNPLENWQSPGKKRGQVDLRNSEDPLVREWVEMKRIEWEIDQKTESVERKDDGRTTVAPLILAAVGLGVLIGFQLGRAKGK